MIDFLNLLILFVLGIVYLYLFAKIQQRYFQSYGEANRPLAVIILLSSSVVTASVNLIHVADLSANANRFFMGQSDYMKSLLFSSCFFGAMWLFSLGLFHLSFFVTGWLTHENESDELAKNNVELAVLHSIILVSLAFIIAPPLIKIASGYIPYPKLPF